MYHNKQTNKYRYHNEKCSNQRSELGLLLGFSILSIFDIQNHLNHDFHFSPQDGAKGKKIIDYRSRGGLFSRFTKFHYFVICLSVVIC